MVRRCELMVQMQVAGVCCLGLLRVLTKAPAYSHVSFGDRGQPHIATCIAGSSLQADFLIIKRSTTWLDSQVAHDYNLVPGPQPCNASPVSNAKLLASQLALAVFSNTLVCRVPAGSVILLVMSQAAVGGYIAHSHLSPVASSWITDGE